jgi:hypothetical protein
MRLRRSMAWMLPGKMSPVDGTPLHASHNGNTFTDVNGPQAEADFLVQLEALIRHRAKVDRACHARTLRTIRKALAARMFLDEIS